MAAEEYHFNSDPAIKNFTWNELLEYNKAFLRGDLKATFYHAGPLLEDQVPEDLIRLHDLGVFTTNGQGTELDKGYNEESKEYYEVEQRSFLEGYMSLALAKKFIREARKDPEVIFEVSQIQTGKQLYLSPEIRAAWSVPNGYISLTREKGAQVEEALASEPWSDYTTQSAPMLMLYEMEDQKFKNWYSWVCSGLCYFVIVDKEYGQEPKSMADRVINYLTAAGGGGVRQKKNNAQRRTRSKRKHTKSRTSNRS